MITIVDVIGESLEALLKQAVLNPTHSSKHVQPTQLPYRTSHGLADAIENGEENRWTPISLEEPVLIGFEAASIGSDMRGSTFHAFWNCLLAMQPSACRIPSIQRPLPHRVKQFDHN